MKHKNFLCESCESTAVTALVSVASITGSMCDVFQVIR